MNVQVPLGPYRARSTYHRRIGKRPRLERQSERFNIKDLAGIPGAVGSMAARAVRPSEPQRSDPAARRDRDEEER
jgi:hypothetical protein